MLFGPFFATLDFLMDGFGETFLTDTDMGLWLVAFDGLGGKARPSSPYSL